MGIAFLMDEQGKEELRTQFMELRAMGNQASLPRRKPEASLFQDLKDIMRRSLLPGQTFTAQACLNSLRR
jgi:hypothetical protein